MAINYIRYIEVDSLIHEYISDKGITNGVKEDILRRWISRATEMCVRVECQVFRVALIDIKNRVGKLPDYLHSIELAGALESGRGHVGREEMRSWVYDKLGTDCEVEVRLNCPQCSQTSCNCSEPVVEIEMDRIYREERPYLTHVNYKHFVGYSAPITDGMSCMDIAPRFHIMKPKITDSAFWNSKHYLGVCNDLGPSLRYAHSFHLEDGKIITTMDEGQVVIAYLANKRDADGYFMVPDNAVLVEAILAYIDYQHSKRMAMRGNQTDQNYSLNCERRWKDLRADAINELEMPSDITWENIINQHWKQGIERFHYG